MSGLHLSELLQLVSRNKLTTNIDSKDVCELAGDIVEYNYEYDDIDDIDNDTKETDETDSDDFIIWTCSNGLKSLLILNHSPIVNSAHIMKCKRIISNSFASGLVNTCMFIALDAPLIPGRVQFDIENILGNPVVYVSIQQNGCVFEMCLSAHVTIFEQFRGMGGIPDRSQIQASNQQNSLNELTSSVLKIGKKMGHFLENITLRKKALSDAMETLDADQTIVEELIQTIHMTQTTDEPIETGNSTVLVNEKLLSLLRTIISTKKKLGRWPKRDETDLSEGTVRNYGGYKQLLTICKKFDD